MIKSNIKELTNRHGIESVAKKCNVSIQTIYTYIKRGYASKKKIHKLAEVDPLFSLDKFKKDIEKNMAKHVLRSIEK